MLFGDRYCSKCGANLTCLSCGGTGKKKEFLIPPVDPPTYCCGMMHTGKYCSNCGKSLSAFRIGAPGEDKCSSCNGTGKSSFHVCSGGLI